MESKHEENVCSFDTNNRATLENVMRAMAAYYGVELDEEFKIHPEELTSHKITTNGLYRKVLYGTWFPEEERPGIVLFYVDRNRIVKLPKEETK